MLGSSIDSDLTELQFQKIKGKKKLQNWQEIDKHTRIISKYACTNFTWTSIIKNSPQNSRKQNSLNKHFWVMMTDLKYILKWMYSNRILHLLHYLFNWSRWCRFISPSSKHKWEFIFSVRSSTFAGYDKSNKSLSFSSLIIPPGGILLLLWEWLFLWFY